MIKEQRRRLLQQNPALQHLFFSIDFVHSPTFAQELNEGNAAATPLEDSSPKLYADASECHPPVRNTVDFLSIRAFKLEKVYQHTVLPTHCFVSSGSTQNQRGQNFLSQQGASENLAESALGFESRLRECAVSLNTPILSLVPPPQAWPQSSLAAMIWAFSRTRRPLVWFPESTLSSSAEHFKLSFQEVLLQQCLSKAQDELIIFGTSLHHLLLLKAAKAANWHWPGKLKKLIIFDTGGTKGRTLDYSQAQMQSALKELYEGCADELILASEYGMCELASQAYSSGKQFNGTFTCNQGMKVRAVNLQNRRECAHGEQGFLAFYDFNNKESYAAVVTEDIGYTVTDHTFVLLGRAPDASAKGCSLNVKENFLLELPNQGEHVFFEMQDQESESCL